MNFFVGILCVGIGIVCGYVGKEFLIKKNKSSSTIDVVHMENDKYVARNKKLVSQVENLQAQVSSLQCKMKSSDNRSDNLTDDLDTTQREVKKLRQTNTELSQQLQQLKSICDAQQAELTTLKNK